MAFENYFHIFLIAVLGYNSVQCTEFVPVFMWGTQKITDLVPALHKISEDSFKDTLLEYLKKDPFVVVFAEQTLSPEDFAHHNSEGESSFKHMSELQEQGNSISYRPAVQNPIGAVKLVKSVTETSIGDILSNLIVPKENIWIINLDDARDDESRFHMLKRHDADIISIYNSILKKHTNVFAMYTANHPSWVAPENLNRNKGRYLLAVDPVDEEPVVLNDSVVLMYLTRSGSLTELKDSKSDVSVIDKDWKLTTSQTQPFFTIEKAGQPSIQFNVSEDNRGYWQLQTLTIDGKETKLSDIYAPRGFSYHCTDFSASVGTEKDGYKLDLPGFQIQWGANGTDKFGDAYDCVGFTSVPIWSGIFVTAILLLIVTFGLIMMMDIKTMDRFDDPKGKTITINASE